MKRIYLIILSLILVVVLLHIEFIIHETYAPLTVLVVVKDPAGNPLINATCFSDIITANFNITKKPLTALSSVYDYVDPNWGYVKVGYDKGYYLLNTTLEKYKGNYEFRIVCYAPSMSGVTYTIINNTDKNCELRNNGQFLIC